MDLPKPDAESEALCIAFLDDLLNEKPEDPPVTAGQVEAFRTLVGLCGLTLAEVATIIGVQPQSLRRKVIGERALKTSEMNALVGIWGRIVNGDVADLPAGAQQVAKTLDHLRAREKRNGRMV